jgi:hypothetical protein
MLDHILSIRIVLAKFPTQRFTDIPVILPDPRKTYIKGKIKPGIGRGFKKIFSPYLTTKHIYLKKRSENDPKFHIKFRNFVPSHF